MQTKTIGVLAVVDEKDEIVAIVYHHEPSRTQVAMKCERLGIDEIQGLFDKMINK